ncbi:MAG: hypothetical protein HY765_11675 [Rhodomicrobium sp.]|nr:hypothetical protein [Rhodomicrobium sp.]
MSPAGLRRHREAAFAAVAIHSAAEALALDCFAPLAMTAPLLPEPL